jgi:hypothetical protein
LIKRLLDPTIAEDFSIMLGGVTVGKTCSLSQHLAWLREQAATKPILFMPSSRLGEPLIGRGFLKSDVRFIDKEDIKKGTIDYAMTADESERPTKRKQPPVAPAEVAKRRARRLKKFYAVTIARLEYNPAFQQSVKRLQDRHERWQITQAACNIICADWFPDARAPDGKVDFGKAYNSLRASPEIVFDARALEKPFTAEVLGEQVRQDIKYLWQQVRPNSRPSNIEAKLRKLGLVR